MKKYLTIVSFCIGVDVLGFPNIIEHHLIGRYKVNSNHFRAYSKK